MTVPKLNDKMAIELGSHLLGELVIFVLGATAVYLEYQRQSRNDDHKEELVLQEKKDIQDNLKKLVSQTELRTLQLKKLTRLLAKIGGKRKQTERLN